MRYRIIYRVQARREPEEIKARTFEDAGGGWIDFVAGPAPKPHKVLRIKAADVERIEIVSRDGADGLVEPQR